MCHQQEWEWGSSALTLPPPKIKQQPDTQNVELNMYGLKNVTVYLINTNPLGNIFKEIIKHENPSFLTFLHIVAININFK